MKPLSHNSKVIAWLGVALMVLAVGVGAKMDGAEGLWFGVFLFVVGVATTGLAIYFGRGKVSSGFRGASDGF